MGSAHLWSRVQGHYKRKIAGGFGRRPFPIQTEVPFISFTFDDFPRSALVVGGTLLNDFGVAGTYYASLGLMGKQEPTGAIFVPDDLKLLFEQGHELGCHTFSHCDAWNTDPGEFERSIIDNERALRQFYPEARFRTFSYPISPPRPLIKRIAERHFMCSRHGGQAFNVGVTDLNYLRAYFLDEHRCDRLRVRKLIDENCRAHGWLIFVTHDVAKIPTQFGCSIDFFQDTLRYAVNSNARILPVMKVLEILRASATEPDRYFPQQPPERPSGCP